MLCVSLSMISTKWSATLLSNRRRDTPPFHQRKRLLTTVHNGHECQFFPVSTLGCQIVVQARLFFWEEKSFLHELIRTCTFINFEDFFLPARLFSPTRLLILEKFTTLCFGKYLRKKCLATFCIGN